MKELSDEVINNLIDWKSSNIPHKVIGHRLFKMGVKNKFGKQMSRYSVSNLMRSQGLRTLPDRKKPKAEIESVVAEREIKKQFLVPDGCYAFRYITVYSDFSIDIGSKQSLDAVVRLEVVPFSKMSKT